MLNQNADKNQVNQEKPLKRFGQNFLIDKTIISTIVSQLKIKPTDTIVEIGPGHGELTEEILENKPKRIIAIEKDERLMPLLGKKFQISKSKFQTNNKIQNHKTKVEIINKDALEVIRNSKLNIRNSDNYKIVGNIPYYITGHLLRILGELENKPEIIVLTIQKEVAERICAEPPRMNLLSASVQFWGTPEIIQVIDKEKFNPVPKVDSAIIRIIPVKGPSSAKAMAGKQVLEVDSESFYKLIKALFKQPRKTIWNNLRQELRIMNYELSEEGLKQKLTRVGINPNDRPQNLDIEDIKLIAEQLS